MDALESRYPLISIEGSAGVGKTSLTLEVAYSLIPQTEEKETQTLLTFNHIVWVSAKDKPKQKDWLLEVLHTIAHILDFASLSRKPPEQIEEIKLAVEDLLRTRLTLIIVDNFETIDDPGLVSWLMTVPEPSKVLVTSRRKQFQMSFPIDLEGLADNDALALIRRHAGTFGLATIQQKPAAELLPLVRNTGGNPLAMVWALRNLKSGTLKFEHIIKELELAYKNKNINSVIKLLFDKAWQQITLDARKVLFSVPLFAGALSISKGALCAASGLAEEDFNPAVVQLTDFKLLQGDTEKDKSRYKVHPMAYTFARVKLDQKPHLEQAARKRWSRYYLKFVQDHIVREQPNKRYWNALVSDNMQAIDEEWGNINEVIKWADQQHQDQLFLELVMLLVHYMDSRFLNLHRMDYVKKAIAISNKQERNEDEALLRLDALGWTYVEENNLDEAYQEIMLGSTMAEQLADDVEAKNDLMALGYAWRARVRIEQGHLTRASALIDMALAIACSPWIRFRVYLAAGDIALKQNRNKEALAFYQQQAASMEEYGGEGHGYQVLSRLGLAYVGIGGTRDIEKAEEKFKALRDNENIPIGKLYGDYGLALVAYKRKQKEEAQRLAKETKEALSRKTTSNLLLKLLDQLFEKIEAENPS
jgi:LuxR family transcriptional regulator, glucitol operon activator